MKVIHVLPSIADESSGPTYYMVHLAEALLSAGVNAELHTLFPLPQFTVEPRFPIVGYPRHDRFNLGLSYEMKRGLDIASQSAEIVHNNSLWMMPNIYSYQAARKNGCKIVTSPHGTLSSWALNHRRLKKRIFGFFMQYPALRETDLFHATCEKEYHEIREAGYRQPVAVIPIGMELPDLVNTSQHDPSRMRRIVYFGRLHAVKGIDRLLLAWNQAYLDGWEVIIAGPDGGALDALQNLVAQNHIPNVSFVGEINGKAKYSFLADADLCVLPSSTENFGVTVAEALASGTPVIASQGTPWKGLERERCGRWIPIGIEPLVVALREMMALSDDERAAMGARGRTWIQRDFSWESIGFQMKQAYEWLLGRGDCPSFVRVE